MKVEFFDVEHGSCALITCDDNTRLMIDCGHNASTGWRPGDYLKSIGVDHLDMLAVTNYDEDHVSGLPNLREKVSIGWLWRNSSVTGPGIRELKRGNTPGKGIEALIDMIAAYNGTSTNYPAFRGLERKAFCHSLTEFQDENNLSLVVHAKCAGMGFMFTGDMEIPGWKKLIERSDVQSALADTKILLASHHGRDDGCCDGIFDHCAPTLIVISDDYHKYSTQETTDWYASKVASPILHKGINRRVLTTRSDGNVTFYQNDGKWHFTTG